MARPPKFAISTDGPITQVGDLVRIEPTKTLFRDDPEGGDPIPYVEHRVYGWRAATEAEIEVHGWPAGHMIWGLVSAHENPSDALAAAVDLAQGE